MGILNVMNVSTKSSYEIMGSFVNFSCKYQETSKKTFGKRKRNKFEKEPRAKNYKKKFREI